MYKSGVGYVGHFQNLEQAVWLLVLVPLVLDVVF